MKENQETIWVIEILIKIYLNETKRESKQRNKKKKEKRFAQ